MVTGNLLEDKNLSLGERVSRRLGMAAQYAASIPHSLIRRRLFDDVKTFCLFIGHARSGHSIVGALLDAHRNVVMADELNALQYVLSGFSKRQIFSLAVTRSRLLAQRGRVKNGRDGQLLVYRVPGQWQGHFDKIQVIGDSKAGLTTQRLARNPEMIDRVRRMMGTTVLKFIHVIRNPFDNISTLMIRGERTFDNAIDRYFLNCETIGTLRKRLSAEYMTTIRHEDLIARPEESVAALCDFVGVSPVPDYLSACAGILYKTPAASRRKVPWTPELIERVQNNIDQFDFLSGYSYDS